MGRARRNRITPAARQHQSGNRRREQAVANTYGKQRTELLLIKSPPRRAAGHGPAPAKWRGRHLASLPLAAGGTPAAHRGGDRSISRLIRRPFCPLHFVTIRRGD